MVDDGERKNCYYPWDKIGRRFSVRVNEICLLMLFFTMSDPSNTIQPDSDLQDAVPPLSSATEVLAHREEGLALNPDKQPSSHQVGVAGGEWGRPRQLLPSLPKPWGTTVRPSVPPPPLVGYQPVMSPPPAVREMPFFPSVDAEFPTTWPREEDSSEAPSESEEEDRPRRLVWVQCHGGRRSINGESKCEGRPAPRPELGFRPWASESEEEDRPRRFLVWVESSHGGRRIV